MRPIIICSVRSRLRAKTIFRDKFLGGCPSEGPQNYRIRYPEVERPGEDKVNALYRAKCGDGQWKWLNLTACAVERRENFIKVYAAFSDCDEMMRTQQELQNNRTDA